MGNYTSIDINSTTDGSEDDIFKLIFSPDDKYTPYLIRAHVVNYPHSLSKQRYITGLGDTKSYGNPLFLACMFSNVHSSNEIVELLINLGSNIDQKIKFGRCSNCLDDLMLTPLMISCLRSHTTSNIKTVKLLLNNKAQMDIKSCCKTALLHICSSYCDKNYELLKLLLDEGADPDITCSDHMGQHHKTAYDLLLTPPTTSSKLQASEVIRQHYLRNNISLYYTNNENICEFGNKISEIN